MSRKTLLGLALCVGLVLPSLGQQSEQTLLEDFASMPAGWQVSGGSVESLGLYLAGDGRLVFPRSWDGDELYLQVFEGTADYELSLGEQGHLARLVKSSERTEPGSAPHTNNHRHLGPARAHPPSRA